MLELWPKATYVKSQMTIHSYFFLFFLPPPSFLVLRFIAPILSICNPAAHSVDISFGVVSLKVLNASVTALLKLDSLSSLGTYIFTVKVPYVPMFLPQGMSCTASSRKTSRCLCLSTFLRLDGDRKRSVYLVCWAQSGRCA